MRVFPTEIIDWFYLIILKIEKIILLSFKIENIYASYNNIDVNITGQTNEDDQRAHWYPNKLLKEEEIEELLFLVI